MKHVRTSFSTTNGQGVLIQHIEGLVCVRNSAVRAVSASDSWEHSIVMCAPTCSIRV